MLGRGIFRVPGEGNLNHPERFTFRKLRRVCPGEIRTAHDPLDEAVDKVLSTAYSAPRNAPRGSPR